MVSMLTIIACVLFALPLVVAVYAYVAYPILLWILGATKVSPPSALVPRSVTIVIPAYNEEQQIRGAIEALLSQDYPADLRQILILSDGSTDRTDDIVKEYAARGVELMRMSRRSGKTAIENASVSLVRGEIVVNSDASTRLHPSAVRALVTAFVDPEVGVASTRDVSIAHQDASANTAEAGYVGYEMWIRRLETKSGGIVGASGSGYAILRDLHRIAVRNDLSRDFSAALTAHRHGYRAVSVDHAVCYVPRTSSLRAEYRRKVRTISRGLETLLHNRDLLEPTHGAFGWKLFSHKICRWIVPVLAVPALFGLSVLSAAGLDWAIALLCGAILVGMLAAVGALWPNARPTPRILSVPTFAFAANVAVVHAVWRVVHGHDDHMWEPTRREPSEAGMA
jgi:cellulose synthase/poly-beta-1,6-N-acetylglucosamine synthase-like glycosyltransferase